MTETKIIKAVFGAVKSIITQPRYRYDYGQILEVSGITLPESFEARFSNAPTGESVRVLGQNQRVAVPDNLMRTGKSVWCYITVHDAVTDGRTMYTIRIPIKDATERTDAEPTPVQQDIISQAIATLNNAAERTSADVETTTQKASEASESATASAQSASESSQSASTAVQAKQDAESAKTASETAQGKAEDAQESAERAKDDAETSERNASESERKAKGYAETASAKADAITGLTAQATTLPDWSSATASYDAETGVMSFGIPKGKDGTNGIDGNDGYSPTASVTKSGKVATITITDKNGTTSAQVSDGEDGATGATPNLTIGTVETLKPSESATATITGTPENPVLNLGIPQGEQGEITTEEFLKAFVTDSASGSIASFVDGADDLPLKSLVVDINPVQDLSHGDPSPENICPISGWTSVDVEQRGKNLLSPNFSDYEEGYNYRFLNNVVPFEKTARFTFTDKDTSIDLSGCYIGFQTGLTTTISTATAYRWAINNGIVQSNTSNMGVYGQVCDGVMIYPKTQETFDKIFSRYNVMVELGSTATPYSPYTGRSITINLGQTVYGGHLDVLSGELLVDRAMVDLGTLTWVYYTATSSLAPYFCANFNEIKSPGAPYTFPINAVCSQYPVVVRGTATVKDKTLFGDGTTTSISQIQIKDSAYTDAASFKTAMNGVMLCYELATPITLTLSPTEIKSLLGDNNLWADAGESTVIYRADTTMYINRKIAEAISALS